MSLNFVNGIILMIIKGIISEDFINYKKPCMVIEFPYCNFKCGKALCQNSLLAQLPEFEINYSQIVKKYMENDITQAIVFMGLEPFDSPHDLQLLIEEFRKYTLDDIVIFTGYYQSEISESITYLANNYKNIIVKFGRYIPNQTPYYDEVLGIKLASNNQYAVKIS